MVVMGRCGGTRGCHGVMGSYPRLSWGDSVVPAAVMGRCVSTRGYREVMRFTMVIIGSISGCHGAML